MPRPETPMPRPETPSSEGSSGVEPPTRKIPSHLRLTPAQEATVVVYEWQGENCARKCRGAGGCAMPSGAWFAGMAARRYALVVSERTWERACKDACESVCAAHAGPVKAANTEAPA